MKKIVQIVSSNIFLIAFAISILINLFFAYLLFQKFQESYEWPSNASCKVGDFEMPFELAIEPTISSCDFDNLIEDLEKLYVNCHTENKNEYYGWALKYLLKSNCSKAWKKLEIEKYLLWKLLENTSWWNLNLNLSGNKVIFSGNIKLSN